MTLKERNTYIILSREKQIKDTDIVKKRSALKASMFGIRFFYNIFELEMYFVIIYMTMPHVNRKIDMSSFGFTNFNRI